MKRNYRISEHRIYHAWRVSADAVGDCIRILAPAVWRGFLQPVIVLAVGVGLSVPVARVLGSFLGNWIGG